MTAAVAIVSAETMAKKSNLTGEIRCDFSYQHKGYLVTSSRYLQFANGNLTGVHDAHLGEPDWIFPNEDDYPQLKIYRG